jgi:hypothetical protein
MPLVHERAFSRAESAGQEITLSFKFLGFKHPAPLRENYFKLKVIRLLVPRTGGGTQ